MDRKWMIKTSAILALISGVTLILVVSLLATGLLIYTIYEELPEIVVWLVMGVTCICYVASLVEIIGGICTMYRRSWGWALVGSIVAAAFNWPLGLASLILLLASESEYKLSDNMNTRFNSA
jgi:hypothetical protein